jgi:hypothetical protein
MAARFMTSFANCTLKRLPPVILLPGYHLSTFCGVHEGPHSSDRQSRPAAVRAAQGPQRRSTHGGRRNSGRRAVKGDPAVFDRLSGGTVVHATATRSLDRAESGAVLVSIPLHLDTDVADLEIKCDLDGPAHARIEQIKISSSIALASHSEKVDAVLG